MRLLKKRWPTFAGCSGTATSFSTFNRGLLMEKLLISRRKLLEMSGLGVGSLAFAYLLHAEDKAKLGSDLRSKPGDFPAKARSVIQLVQNGGPSQMDLFDRKPEL